MWGGQSCPQPSFQAASNRISVGIHEPDFSVMQFADTSFDFGTVADHHQLLDVASRSMLAAAEHQMFEQVREPGLAWLLVLRADVIPDVDGYDGCFMVFMHDQGEPIIQYELLVRNVNIPILRLHKSTGGKNEKRQQTSRV